MVKLAVDRKKGNGGKREKERDMGVCGVVKESRWMGE